MAVVPSPDADTIASPKASDTHPPKFADSPVAPASPLVLQPLPAKDSLSDTPFRFSIGMAVRRRDKALRDSLQAVLDKKAPEIDSILKEYGIPLLPIEEGQEAPKSSDAAPQPKADTTRVSGRG